MANRRTPLHIAHATGRDRVNPARFNNRHRHKPEGVGEPPAYLGGQEHVVWNEFVQEMPWLQRSDRAALELACQLRVMTRKPDCSPRDRTLLRSLLADLGGNPTRRGHVDDPQGDLFGGDDDDPAAAEYLS